MNRYFRVFLCCVYLCAALQSFGAADASEVIGTWEGQSLCTVPNSPCHDEHVVYHIKRAEHGDNLVVSAYKIVNGEEQFMGDLECQYHAAATTLSCSFPRNQSDWEFHVSGKHMSGTLVMGKEKTLYRKVSVDRRRD